MDILTEPEWRLVSPGVLALAGTQITIQWAGHGSWMICWNGKSEYGGANMADAKRIALRYFDELSTMGFEP